jgi:glutamate synthase domain-containing protein 2
MERVSRQSVFVMVGVDALLAGHADHGLRERAHQAYARKCKELGLSANAGEGGQA